MIPSADTEVQGKINNAARIFMERSREYDEMIEEARSEYRIGMRHLANMMGVDPETFTQNDANVSFWLEKNKTNGSPKTTIIHSEKEFGLIIDFLFLFSQSAIEYLFPSGLYDKKAKPFMKPPEEVFPSRKRIQFDKTGRPFHCFFFTGFPNYYQVCHVSVNKIFDHIRCVVRFVDFVFGKNCL